MRRQIGFGDLGPFDRRRNRQNKLLHPLARLRQQGLVLVERLAEFQQALEEAVRRKPVGDGHGAEVVDHHLDRRAGLIPANLQASSFLHEAERSRPVFEILRGSRLVPEAAALCVSRDPAVNFLQIDQPPDIIRKHRLTGAVLTRSDDGDDAVIENSFF